MAIFGFETRGEQPTLHGGMSTTYSTGVVVRPDRLEWTVWRVTRKGSVRLDHGRIERSAAEAESDPEWRSGYRRVAARARGEVTLGLESGSALMRVLELPTTDPTELANMAELQVDKFSPFPVEQMAIGVQPLSATERATRVLIVAVQKERVEQAGSLARNAGLRVHRVDVEVLGWWQLLRDAGAVPETGHKAFLIIESGGVDLILARNGQPVLFRALGPLGGDLQTNLEEIVEETAYTLTSAEAELGGVERISLEIRAPREVATKDLEDALQRACAVEVTTAALDDLPPLSEGLARRGADPAARTLNLAPEPWRIEEEARRVVRRLAIASLSFLTIWGGLVAGGLVGLNMRRDRLNALAREVERLETPAAEVRALKEKVTAIERYMDRTYSALEYLREVSLWLPERIDLTGFDYRKGDGVTLMGRAAVAESIYDFVQALQRTELMKDARAENIRSVGSGEDRRSEFVVTASWPEKKPAEEESAE